MTESLGYILSRPSAKPRRRPWVGFQLVAALTYCLLVCRANAAGTKAELMLAQESAQAGQTVLAGIRLTMPPGVHTYWRNPGDSGLATTLQWTLPPGVTTGDIQWPAPEKLQETDLITYVYFHQVILLVPLSVPSNFPPGILTCKVKVAWLECKESCVPGDAVITNSLMIGQESRPASAAVELADAQKKLAATPAPFLVRASWENTATNDIRRLAIDFTPALRAANWDFYAYESDLYQVESITESDPTGKDRIRLVKQVKRLRKDWPPTVKGLLVAGAATNQPVRVWEVDARPETSGPASDSLWLMLLYAFLGGLILNVMPCVLPVIALKILGFVQQSQTDPGRIRRLGLVYGAGVLVSFLAMATVAILVQRAGRQAGWGMQFGNPMFLVALMTLVTLVALNLFGLFEVVLSSRALGAATELSSREGATGAFFNGILATLLATPCTAPFLGYALGFAFTQSPGLIVLVFLAIGTGLALPYVLLSWQPSWLSIMPKPGIWMEYFKKAMGFPMLATAIWLFSLTPLFYGRRILWLGLFLLLISLAAWIFGEFIQRGRRRRGLAWGVVLGILAFAWFYVLEGQLRWRSPLTGSGGYDAPEISPTGIAWKQWNPAALAEARAQKRPVLVDFTADWCLTCQANKRISLEIPSVQAKLKEIQAVALLADYTRVSVEITAELARFGRRGVPLVLVYPSDPAQPPIVLPEILTPQTVLNALDKAR